MGFFDNCVLRLHDGTIESYARIGSDFRITIRKWDQTQTQLTIKDIVYLQEQMGDGDDLEGLFAVRTSVLLDQVIARLKTLHWPDEDTCQLRHFQMLDLSAFPVLDVIGKRWEQAIMPITPS